MRSELYANSEKERSGKGDASSSDGQGRGEGSLKVGGGLVGDGTAVVGHDHSVVTVTFSEGLITLELVVEDFHNCFAHGHGLLEDSPLDTFRAGRSGERTIIAPEMLGIELLDKIFHGHLVLILDHSFLSS